MRMSRAGAGTLDSDGHCGDFRIVSAVEAWWLCESCGKVSGLM